MKRRTIGLGLVAAALGGLGVYGATAASATPTPVPSQPPPVTVADERATTTGNGTDMDAMMRQFVDQLPADARDQAWRMHEQMQPAMRGVGSDAGMNSMMSNGSMMNSTAPDSQ